MNERMIFLLILGGQCDFLSKDMGKTCLFDIKSTGFIELIIEISSMYKYESCGLVL